MKKTKWGIVGTGNISNKFAESLSLVEGAELIAVASRSLAKAKDFAEKYSIKKYYSSSEEMARDKEIQIVYIGTPHIAHLKDTLMFLDAGYNVLCEKPIGINAKQTNIMIEKAREKNVFLMEGMWTRFFPAVKKGLEWINNGRIGTPKTLFANFGIDNSINKDKWRYQRSMAGGALLDVGIYPLAMAFSVFGSEPINIKTAGYVENGIDEYSTTILEYAEGKFAVLGNSVTVRMENKVVINGTKGTVIIGDGFDWWRANKAELMLGGKNSFSFSDKKEIFIETFDTFGFQYEVEAVQNYVKMGLKEAPEMPLDESLKIAKVMDELRKMWNVTYDDD